MEMEQIVYHTTKIPNLPKGIRREVKNQRQLEFSRSVSRKLMLKRFRFNSN